MQNGFEIGKVVGAHGIKGMVKIFPTTGDPNRFSNMKEVVILQNETYKTFTITKAVYHKQYVLLELVGIVDRNQAEAMKGGILMVEEDQGAPLEDNEYYLRDLYGMKVYTENEEYLGELMEILSTGANDVYIVRQKEKPEDRDLLIPAIKQCILHVNVPEKKMIVHLLKGLK